MPRSIIAGSCCSCMFRFWRHNQIVFQSGCTNLYSTSNAAAYEWFSFYVSLPTFCVVATFSLAILIGIYGVSLVAQMVKKSACNAGDPIIPIIYWSGFPLPGDLLDPGIEPISLASPALEGGFFTIEPPGGRGWSCRGLNCHTSWGVIDYNVFL